MSNAEFVPAIGEQFNAAWKRKLVYKKKYDMKFFTPQSHFSYPLALQCGFYGIHGVGEQKKGIDMINFRGGKDGCIGSEKYKTCREQIGYPNDYTLITDSAGFQIATYKLKGEEAPITPLQSLRWQEANATEPQDIAMNLDVPPSIGASPTHEQFVDALKTSVENFQFFKDNRKNNVMKLYNVLHGGELQQIKEWYEAVKHFNFDGWAVGVKPSSDPMIQALGIMYLYEKGELDPKKSYGMHIFGTSGKVVVPTIVYIANKLKIKVTYDSSSYNVGSIYRRYYMPLDYGPHLFFGEKFKRLNPNTEKLPCRCPVCTSITDISDLNNVDLFAGPLISLHNLYQYIYYNDLLNILVKNKQHFTEYITRNIRKQKTIKSIEFVDYVLEHGVDRAALVFKDWLTPDTINNKKQQADIFGFT